MADTPREIALRVDVDFAAGLERAVPWMLERLARGGARATFFIVAGSNRPRLLLRRLARPGYLRRLARLGALRTLAPVGRPWPLGGGAMLGTARRREMLRQIVDAGHEVAVHGHDHAWWSDRVWDADEARLTDEARRAFDGITACLGPARRGWGAPGWRTSAAGVRAASAAGARYAADCWGDGPFVPLDEHGVELPLVELPVTLPGLEGEMLARGLTSAEAARRSVAARRPGRIDVVCVHDYFEGLARRDAFEALLDVCDRDGIAVLALEDVLARTAPAGLPRVRLARRPVDGFAGDVSCQAPTGPQEAGPSVPRADVSRRSGRTV